MSRSRLSSTSYQKSLEPAGVDLDVRAYGTHRDASPADATGRRAESVPRPLPSFAPCAIMAGTSHPLLGRGGNTMEVGKTPKEIRQAIRQGRYTGGTAGLAPGHVQAHLRVLPKAPADD